MLRIMPWWVLRKITEHFDSHENKCQLFPISYRSVACIQIEFIININMYIPNKVTSGLYHRPFSRSFVLIHMFAFSKRSWCMSSVTWHEILVRVSVQAAINGRDVVQKKGLTHAIFMIYLGFVVRVYGVRLCLWTAASSGPTLHPAGDTWVWNTDGMILTEENQRTQGKHCTSSTLSTTNPTWANLGLRGETPLTNRLSRATADKGFTVAITGFTDDGQNSEIQ
jgi:hypothetical protein